MSAGRRGRAGAWALVCALAACRGGGPPGARLPAKPSDAWAAALPPGGEAGAAAGLDAGVPPDDGTPRLCVVLDDPRLAAVREREVAHDDAAAALELSRAMAAAGPLGPQESCAWSYELGRLHLAASEPTEAAAAFERVASAGDDASTPCSLAPYALLRRSQALLRVGLYDDAAASARAVGGDIAARDEARLALAEALAARGDRAGAVPLWRDWLAAPGQAKVAGHGREPRWVDVSLRLAAALLDGADGPARGRAAEGLDLCTRVLVESPGAAEKTDVLALRGRAAALAGQGSPPPLTPDERARQAQAWLDTSQAKRAKETAEALLKALPATSRPYHEAGCRAAIVLAQATPRGKADGLADAWGVAIARCEGEDALATALYSGGKASASAQRYADALARFEKVEQLFPKHRLADDARLRASLVWGDQGDAAKSEAMLSSISDAYPDGDMRGDALVRVALAKIGARDYSGAAEVLDRAMAVAHDDRAQGVGGRAAYFRARAAELAAELDDARDRYAALIAGEPLSYYMLLAYARLRALDEGRARAAREGAEAREPPGPLITGEHPELAAPSFERFRRLLEVGELDAARREATAGGLTAEGVAPEVLWTVASLYDRAGAPDLGHAFARGRLVDYRAHWPAGRWRRAWEVAFPRVWEPIVARESAAAQIAAPLVWGIMREESAFNPEAKSVANALGLMQLLAGTARQAAKGTPFVVDDDALKRPEVSISLGARMLSSLRRSFPGHPALAIAAYNAGSRSVRRWLAERPGDDLDVFVDRIPFDETRAYVKRVVASQAAYAYLYAPDALDEYLTLPAGSVSSLSR